MWQSLANNDDMISSIEVDEVVVSDHTILNIRFKLIISMSKTSKRISINQS